MRTTLDLPDTLFRTLKTQAAMDGTTLKDLVVRLIEHGLAAPAEAPTVKRAPFPVLVDGPLGSPPQAFMSNQKLYELLDAEDDAKAMAMMHGLPFNQESQ